MNSIELSSHCTLADNPITPFSLISAYPGFEEFSLVFDRISDNERGLTEDLSLK